MQKILGCLLLLLAPNIMRATDCPQLVLTLYSDQGFDMRLLIGNTAAGYVRVRLYSGVKLVRSFVTNQDGEFGSGSLPEGTYLLVVSSKENLEVKVRRERSGLHGPFVIWHLLGKPGSKSNHVSSQPCPVLAIKG